MMRVLGIDLGSTHHGLAVLDIDRGVATYRTHEGRMSTAETVLIVAHLRGCCDLLVLETATGPHGGMDRAQAISSGRAFAAANRQAIRIAEAAGLVAIPVVEVTAREVRTALGCGNTDSGVKAYVTRWVAGWPKRSANHARDAAAAAIVGARVWTRMQAKGA